jgi:ribose transport system permease protein
VTKDTSPGADSVTDSPTPGDSSTPGAESAPAGPLSRFGRGGRKRSIRVQELAVPGICLALFIALSIASSSFLTSLNIRNILDQNSAVGIIACGETLVIISGSFDLSVGAIYAFAGLVAVLVSNDLGPLPGMLIAILSGIGLGVANGVLVVVGRVHSFIATLASQYVFNGLALVISGGLIVQATSPSFVNLGQNSGLGVNYTIWSFLGVALIAGLLLQRTPWGRYVFAVGGNLEAARLSGIRVGLIRGSVFALSGGTAAFAGVVAASRVGTAQAGTGTGLELAGIATTVLGGTSIFGGEGAIWRTILGVLLLAMIGNGFDLLSISATYQQIVEGVLIIFAVVIDAYTRLRR